MEHVVTGVLGWLEVSGGIGDGRRLSVVGAAVLGWSSGGCVECGVG